MNTQSKRGIRSSLAQKHRSARSILAYRKAERKKDAMALAELIYDVFREKKRKENDKVISGQNNAKHCNQN